MKYSFFISLFFLVILGSHGQNFRKIDSLKKNISTSHLHDSVKAASFNSLAREYWSVDPDSSVLFCNFSIQLAEKINNRRLVSGAMLYKAFTFGLLSRFDSALVAYDRAYNYSMNAGYKKNAGNALMGSGNTYNTLGEFNRAITYYTKALKIQESQNDSLNMHSALNGLGLVFESQGDYKKALEYHYKALKIREAKGNKMALGISHNNIGTIHHSLKNFDTALTHFNKALAIFSGFNDLPNTAMMYCNLGNLYSDMGKRSEAINYLKNAYRIYKDLNNTNQAAAQLLNLGIVYGKYKQYDEAIKNMLECEKVAASLNSQMLLKNCYGSLLQAYYLSGNYKKAFDYNQKYSQLKDSLFDMEKVKEINKLNTLYETEKKEKENKLLQKENELSAKTIRQQKTIVYFIIGCLTLVMLFLLFVYRAYRQKRLANNIISAQKLEVEKQKEIVEQQKYLVEEHQKEILDSIHYAKRIQNTLLAHHDFLDNNLPQNFVLFMPKDIVSGDFYWAASVPAKAATPAANGLNDLFYLAVCDSTGHGVPGAFMSLLNIGFLSEAINEKGLTEPHQVLNYVRQRLIGSISKEGQQDGFDGILLCINRNTSEITYAAANNSPLLLTGTNPGTVPRMIHLPSDKMPVGKGEKKDDFKLYSVNANPGDTLYLYTDGYADQFGGPKGKKFKYKQLEELLLSVNELPLPEQKDILKNRFEEWKGKLEQVDDVCLIGIKI